MFSDQPVPQQVIEDVLLAASTAPSGAHQQPWTFVAISDPVLKHEIRVAAQAEEVKNYAGRMPPAWLQALAPLGTDPDKPHLEVAPWVVVVFAQKHGVDAQGEPIKHYYVRESVGMACGMLAAAVHQAGLVTLTHTPSPMAFLGKLLDRPRHEQAYVVMPIGHPASDCVVPDIQRKSLEQVAVFHTNEHDRPRALTRADRDALAASEDPG
jgi:nitroreductase